MYFKDVHIIYFIIIAVLGVITGKLADWANYRLPEYKKVFSFEIFKHKASKSTYFMIIANVILNLIILYRFGIGKTFIENLELIKYILLTPMLLSVFVIDYKLQIIPNRLNLTMFEIGLIIAFIFGLSNIAITIDMLLGMLVGGGIFLLITVLGGLFYGKEAMGLGDVKLMGALGLYFGISNIIAVALMSFLIGAILSILLLVTKIKKTDEYIPFGPFIVISSLISILVPFDIILKTLMTIFTLGLYQKNK